MIALGLDGYREGWVAVLLDGARQELSFHRGIADALSRPFDKAGIDIPIGTPDDGERSCDLLARSMLRPHASRVFTGARRWLWRDFSDPGAANEEALRRGQKRVSRQLWHLGAKISEVDAFVRTNASRNICEVHPELVFLRLNGNKPLSSKKTEEGDMVRRGLLKRQGIANIDKWLDTARIGHGAKRDDVLDACAVAVAIRNPAGCLPEGKPPFDECGLPMQIWF